MTPRNHGLRDWDTDQLAAVRPPRLVSHHWRTIAVLALLVASLFALIVFGIVPFNPL